MGRQGLGMVCAVFAAGALACASAVAAHAHGGGVHSSAERVPLLVPGGTLFWSGGRIDRSTSASPAPALTWKVRLGPGGHRLRAATDTPSRADEFAVTLIDPDGKTVATGSAGNVFNVEAFASKPVAGVWTVKVQPENAEDATLRVRTKLETSPAPAGPRRMTLPNLRGVPPYEFGFVAPANVAQGLYPPDTIRPLPPDTTNPPLQVGGQAPLSCAADEMAPAAAGGADANVCLRFTAGPINVGEGHFVKRFQFAQDMAANPVGADQILRGHSRQTIYWSDGTTSSRPGGTYSFHVTHSHFHDDGILTYDLFRLDGPKDPTPVPAGKGTKSGFCPADQLIGDWRAFDQAPSGSFGEGDSAGGSCFSPVDGVFALTHGWGDVYRWQRPGQYVEFEGNGDGYYLLRTTVDKGNATLESDENDNSAYAVVRVVGRSVDLLERGQGTSQVDPCKVVFTGYGPASHDGRGGPLAVGRRRPAGDCRSPVLSRLSMRRPRPGGRRRAGIAFTLSEKADVRVAIRRTRKGRTRTLRVFTARAPRAGRMRMTAGTKLSRKLRGAGRYRITAVAVDSAGNRDRRRTARAR